MIKQREQEQAAYALQMAERQYRGGSISMLEVNDAHLDRKSVV